MMLPFFKNRRPKPSTETEPAPDLGDIMTAYAWCLNLHQWHSLTDFERANCRRNVTAAPRYQA